MSEAPVRGILARQSSRCDATSRPVPPRGATTLRDSRPAPGRTPRRTFKPRCQGAVVTVGARRWPLVGDDADHEASIPEFFPYVANNRRGIDNCAAVPLGPRGPIATVSERSRVDRSGCRSCGIFSGRGDLGLDAWAPAAANHPRIPPANQLQGRHWGRARSLASFAGA